MATVKWRAVLVVVMVVVVTVRVRRAGVTGHGQG
jgi:hypothetical protein